MSFPWGSGENHIEPGRYYAAQHHTLCSKCDCKTSGRVKPGRGQDKDDVLHQRWRLWFITNCNNMLTCWDRSRILERHYNRDNLFCSLWDQHVMDLIVSLNSQDANAGCGWLGLLRIWEHTHLLLVNFNGIRPNLFYIVEGCPVWVGQIVWTRIHSDGVENAEMLLKSMQEDQTF